MELHTVDWLHHHMPEFRSNIRRSRRFKMAAVIATGPKAARSLVVTWWSLEPDSILVHLCPCRPRDLEDGLPRTGYDELNPRDWLSLRAMIERFMAGDDYAGLCACEDISWP